MDDDSKVPVKMDGLDYQRIFLAVVVIFITLAVFAVYRRFKLSKRGVLITGLCDSGKTLIFSHLIHKRFVNTQTSIRENLGDYVVKNGMLRVIDIPGHERLRYKFFDQYKHLARGIVFVVDSSTVAKDIRDVAEYLYNVFSDVGVAGNSTSILILCNKQDLSLSKGANAVRSMLEKELNTVCMTKSRQLESVDPKSARSGGLLKDGKDFDFSLLSPIKVDFAESHAFDKDKMEAADVEQLRVWLAKIA